MGLRDILLAALLTVVSLPVAAQTTTVSVTFDQGVIGTFGNNTGQANDVVNTTNLGITSITFSQETDNGRFGGTQGNDYCGTLTLVGSPTVSFNACVNWRITETGTSHYIGFIPEEAESFDGPTSLTYTGPLERETYDIIVQASLDNEAPESNFAFRTNEAAPGYADGVDVNGNAAAATALEELNKYLDTKRPVISGPETDTVDGKGTGETEVEEGTTDVAEFTVDTEGAWSLEGTDADLFDISEGQLSFKTAPVFDGEFPANNVYVVDIVVTTDDGVRSVMTFTVTVTQKADTTKPEITGPNETTVEGKGEDETEVTEGTTSVQTFGINEDVTWTLEGNDAGLFKIDEDGSNFGGKLSFLAPPVFDTEDARKNVYILDIVATDADGNRAVMTFTVTVTQLPDTTKPEITGPNATTVDGTGADATEVPDGTTTVAAFSADEEVEWSLEGDQADRFTISEDGTLSFAPAVEFDPLNPADNVYVVDIVATDADGNRAVMTFTITVLDTAVAALARERDEVEQIILDAEVAKLRGQQGALRSMTSAARDRLAGGACGQSGDEESLAGSDDDEACRVEENDVQVSVSEKGTSLVGHNKTLLAFDGYRRITSLDLSILDQNDLRTLSFNGHFALEDYRAENALYGIFAGVSVNSSDVARGSTGRAESYGVSVGAYAVHELRPELFSEVYLSVGRSQNQLDLTDGYLDVAADYGTTEAHFGWMLSGEIRKDDWDILPELGLQLSRSASSAIEVTGATPDDLATVTWEGLTATLARANLSTEFRYYLGGRADDAWVLDAKPGVVCERVRAVTEVSGCGISASLGLNRTSLDGTHRFSADVGVEEIDGMQRRSATLEYELRF